MLLCSLNSIIVYSNLAACYVEIVYICETSEPIEALDETFDLLISWL